jgi:hypothetical protein
MAITEKKDPTPELAMLVLSVPPERIGELKALATWKIAVAHANADNNYEGMQPDHEEYWHKEEEFWKSIREQLNQ